MDRSARPSVIILFLALFGVASCAHDRDKVLSRERINQATISVQQEPALIRAVRQRDALAIRDALAAGEAINSVYQEDTAFSVAVKSGEYAIAEQLLNFGAVHDLGFANERRTALMLAASEGENRLVKRILRDATNLDALDEQGYSALALAAKGGHMTTMKLLIANGAGVNVQPEGKSLLQHMVLANNPLLVQVLLEAGADVNFRTDDGDTALKMARRAGYFDLDLMLVQAGAGF